MGSLARAGRTEKATEAERPVLKNIRTTEGNRRVISAVRVPRSKRQLGSRTAALLFAGKPQGKTQQ
jgi:hypothetical protein